jgi:2'-5' RNA ligase
VRSFIAIDFDDAVRKQLGRLQESLRDSCTGVRWTRPEQLHLTLKFLGEIDERQIESISRALDELAGQCAPFDVQVRGMGTFTPSGPVRIVWVGLEDADGGLARCHSVCERLLSPLGFAPENRPFSPHLTLGRNNNPRNSRAIRAAIAGAKQPDAGFQTVEGIVLYHSTLGRGGPTYEALSRHELRGPGS